MALPGTGHNVGTPTQQILGQIDRMIAEQVASALRSLPIQWDAQGNITIPNGNSLTVTGSAIIDGNLDSGNYQPGATGYQLSGTSAEINTGLIGNSALLTPVLPGVANGTGSNFPLTHGSWTAVATATTVVPTGCTKLLAFVSGYMFAVNPNTAGGSNGTGGDALYTYVSAGSSVSNTYATGISGSSGFATSSASSAFLLTGLTPGASLALTTWGSTGYANLAASTSNKASVSGQLVWLTS